MRVNSASTHEDGIIPKIHCFISYQDRTSDRGRRKRKEERRKKKEERERESEREKAGEKLFPSASHPSSIGRHFEDSVLGY
jgi:hypothetical protein